MDEEMRSLDGSGDQQSQIHPANGCPRMWTRHLCLWGIWVLCSTIPGVEVVKVTVKTPSVEVTKGRSILLPCAFRTTAALNRLNIIWTVSPLFQPQHPLQVISYEQGQIVESMSEYMGRVKFVLHPTADASIYINGTRSSDTGTYQCTVINPPDGATPNIGLIGLTVLVPPSRPDCSSEGTEQDGGSIRLKCSVREGVPAPTFRWEKIHPDHEMLITNQDGDLQGFATKTNISTESSGLYRCTVANPLGLQNCAVELHVQTATLGTMGLIVGIVITLIMGAVLLGLLATVLHIHQQSRRTWEKPNEEIYQCKSEREDTPTRERNSMTRDPVWVLSSQTKPPSTHLLYGAQHTRVSIGTGFGSTRQSFSSSIEGESLSDSEDDEDVGVSTGIVSVPIPRYYSLNSGVLV